MNHIIYNKGYKYQLKQTYTDVIEIKPNADIVTDYIKLDAAGNISIIKGYAWDGPSGPTIDTKDFMRGSLVHDALYQLMREKYLDHEVYRKTADDILRRICIEDGMCKIRAWYVYKAVRLFADPAADPANERPPVTAP